jgi:hypothetical protein
MKDVTFKHNSYSLFTLSGAILKREFSFKIEGNQLRFEFTLKLNYDNSGSLKNNFNHQIFRYC